MAIYVALLGLVIICGFLCFASGTERKKNDAIFLNIIFIAIFLIYSLRAHTVGRDLPGYFSAYKQSSINNFDKLAIGNFEMGYLYFMWICNKIGLSFQWFLTICNIIILTPIYLFIRKYSKNVYLSAVIYICYMFFEFNLTGIRQAIANSIILFGILILLKVKRFPVIWYTIIVLFATVFHKSAFVGLLYIPFHFIKKPKNYVISIAVTGIIFLFGRSYIMRYIKDLFEKDSMNANANLYIGMNVIFLIIVAVITIYGQRIRNKKHMLYTATNDIHHKTDSEENATVICVTEKMFYLSIALAVLFGADTAARSYMVFNQTIIVLLPNTLRTVFDKKSQILLTIIFTIFFYCFMYMNTLRAGGFDIVPYRFFWQI